MSQSTIPNWSELTPAYGRDYKTKAAAKEDFFDGKDWKYAPSGQYTSIRDCMSGNHVLLRYARLTKVVSVQIP